MNHCDPTERTAAVIETLRELVSFPSVSSSSNRSISDSVTRQLESLGFSVERTTYRDQHHTEKVNLVARRDSGSQREGPQREGSKTRERNLHGLAYFCHTDVVPANHWAGPGGDPFRPTIEDNRLYGRGSCDMKGSLAAMLVAVAGVDVQEQNAPLWIVCTADEETGFLGAKHIVRHSAAYRGLVDSDPVAIIGEPTELSVVHAHKGIVGLRFVSRGRAAHSSRLDGKNANLAIVPLLQRMLEIHDRTREDPAYQDARFDPPVLSWNFGVSDGCHAINVTPEKSVAWVSFRSMPEIHGEDLIEEMRSLAEDLGIEFTLLEGGSPVWVDPDDDSIQAFCQLAGSEPKTVCYGTDGGEFTELSRRVVIGPGNIAQAHTSDEWIDLDQLRQGVELYRKAIRRWCVGE